MFDPRRVQPLSLILGALLGACATAAAESVAAAPEPAPPAPAPLDAGPPAAVTAIEQAPVRESPAGTASIVHLARGRHAYVGKLTLHAGAAVDEHQDATEEYIHVLEGAGSVTIDGQTQDVKAGTTIFMPADATVSFQNGAQTLVAIQVFAGPESATKYDGWLEPGATPVQRPKR